MSGAPIAGATVTLGETVVGNTDTTGALFIDPRTLGLPLAGDILVSADGYDTDKRFYVSPGAVTLKLVAEGRIEGIVIEKQAGKAIASVGCGRTPPCAHAAPARTKIRP